MPAPSLYLALRAAMALLFATAWTTAAVYLVETAGLSPLQLVLVGTVVELAIFVAEIPTGVVADSHSRRLSVQIGCGLIGLGLVLWGAVPIFAWILIAQVIWGVGYTFISGALDAWLADEVGETDAARLYLRGAQAYHAAFLVGIGASVALASAGRQLPLMAAGMGFVAVAGWLVAVMPERGFQPTPHADRANWGRLRATLSAGLAATRQRPDLLTLMGAVLVAGWASEALDRLWEAHLLESFTFPALTLPVLGELDPVAWFGILAATATLLTLAATRFAEARASHLDAPAYARLFTVQALLWAAGLALFATTRSFAVAALAWVAIYGLRHTAEPLRTAWVNRGLDPATRATVLSTVNQADALGQTAGGPLLGVVASGWGLRVALGTAAVLLVPAAWLYRRAKPRLDTSP